MTCLGTHPCVRGLAACIHCKSLRHGQDRCIAVSPIPSVFGVPTSHFFFLPFAPPNLPLTSISSLNASEIGWWPCVTGSQGLNAAVALQASNDEIMAGLDMGEDEMFAEEEEDEDEGSAGSVGNQRARASATLAGGAPFPQSWRGLSLLNQTKPAPPA